MNDRYIVFSSVEGVIVITSDYNKALGEYNRYKKVMEIWSSENELDGNETLILSKINKSIVTEEKSNSLALKELEYDN